MATSFRKKRSNIDLVLQDARGATAHGGQLIVDALAKDFGLWKKIQACGYMDPRKDKSRGFSPEAIVSQILFSFCSGGISLADAGRLSEDKALGQLLGMERWADESTLGEWLRAQNKESLKQLWAMIREFVGWVLKKAKPGRVRHGGQLEVFFDDTQIEVDGRCFKGTAINYEGALSYSWQTLWVGPFLADGEWGPGSRNPSESLRSTLEATASLWEKDAQSGCAHFYADSASSAGRHMDLHHPPCLSNEANAFYYGLGALAFNLLMAVKVLLLEDHQQAWSVRTLIRFWLTVPVKIGNHAHRARARIFIPKAAMRWWRLFLVEHYPKRKPGRPPKEPDLDLVPN